MIFAPSIKSISRKSCKVAATSITFTKRQHGFGQKLENPEKKKVKRFDMFGTVFIAKFFSSHVL